MGAVSVEKHFTIDKKLPDSPDHRLSVDQKELTEMVNSIRKVELSKGEFVDGFYPSEEKAYKFARKSIVANKDIFKNEVITEDMLTAKRPGIGLSPDKIDLFIGKMAKIDILEDEIIALNMFKE